MIYLPTMLIFTLTASLIVAFIMNPVFAVDFMNHPDEEGVKKNQTVFKSPAFWIPLGAGILFDLSHVTFLGNLLMFFSLLVVLNTYVFEGLIHRFQNKVLPCIMSHYERLIKLGADRMEAGMVAYWAHSVYLYFLFYFLG